MSSANCANNVKFLLCHEYCPWIDGCCDDQSLTTLAGPLKGLQTYLRARTCPSNVTDCKKHLSLSCRSPVHTTCSADPQPQPTSAAHWLHSTYSGFSRPVQRMLPLCSRRLSLCSPGRRTAGLLSRMSLSSYADAGAGSHSNWRENMITDRAAAQQLAGQARRVAVLGIKTEQQANQPAYYVADYLANAGVDVVPVPVYYPGVTSILGKQVYRRLQDIPGEVDIVDVFRRPQDIPAHVDDILAAKPKAVWLQSGISHPAVEEQLARAGIKVVSDMCLMVEHRQSRARL